MILACVMLGALLAAQADRVPFAYAGEGYSSRSERAGIDVSWRRFSAADLTALCRTAPSPRRLGARPRRLKLRVGDRFPLGGLNITAIGEKGAVIGPIPIAIEIEERDPEIVSLDQFRTRGGPIGALRPGSLRVRVQTLCAKPPVQTVVYIDIRPR